MDTSSLKESWAIVRRSGDKVPQYFYSHLFVSHPDLRAMFPIQMSGQRDKLVAALGAIISNADNLDEITPFIEQLGRDHRRFSVVTEHYMALGGTLMATLKRFLGPSWDAELADTWAQAYGLIAKVMVAAAEQHEDVAPALWDADVVHAERRSMDVAVVEVVPRQPFSFLAGQSVAMEIPQRPRLWRYFSPANAPDSSGRLEFHVQPIAGGMVSTTLVRQLGKGDTVRLAAPVGQQLTLVQEGPQSDLLMIAGGTGLAPLRAVLEQIDRKWETSRSAPRVHLFHGSRMPWNLYDNKHLTELARKPWFDYTPVVSEDRAYPGVRGLVGTVAARSGDWARRKVLVCGPEAMVRHTVGELKAVGVPANQIRREQFDFAASAPSEESNTWEAR